MRNFLVLGASALVLALGVAQASALSSAEQQAHVAATNSPAATSAISDLAGFRGEWFDQEQDASPSLYHRGR